MDKWTAVAHALASSDKFGRPDFDGKKASNMFSALIEAHMKKNNESARASGVAEDMTEKDALMDDLIAAYDDDKEEEARRAIESKQALEQNGSMGAFAREEAMTSLGKRKNGDDDSCGSPRPSSIFNGKSFIVKWKNVKRTEWYLESTNNMSQH
ncbi:hypothetical protein H310_04905 [Aphanomyces invadans]|uniref:Uncharacterized protein n=1 Tax=Aphanomyces invadans TaxID=157072 RepID=A0A024UCW8_9STRA|nr:hypothetical protein H310_04905 [Aphanomyces invadans]ETW03443.1 hypothetical protein H310_04905 [Aphanomyces invadans]|eukprot:XP_008867672.1 hypothetical protein H310_04905 [Aphanomyces invadans]